ncbi:hypothetical protein [Nocardia amikacinitolerans]|uniref:hypothetical protein n=1 Tax=Nocardia amikacinitolerans TaxID=756689 RepID=UPI0012ED3406|nr:hypothetical protein [Nocardia amikacinitolerans]
MTSWLAPKSARVSGLHSFDPKSLQSSDRLGLVHGPDFAFGEADPMDQQVDQIGGQGLTWRFRCTAVGQDAVRDALPEFIFGDFELISQDMRPQSCAVARAIDRV